MYVYRLKKYVENNYTIGCKKSKNVNIFFDMKYTINKKRVYTQKSKKYN